MMIIGCDYHPAFQQIASVDTETGELRERRPMLHQLSRSILQKRYPFVGAIL
jgi:hypothetical protein